MTKIKFSDKSKNEVVLLTIFLVVFSIVLLISKCSMDSNVLTISQYVEYRHRADSIKYTTENILYAKGEVKKLFQDKRVRDLHFDNAEYSDSLQAYYLIVHYRENGKSIKKHIVLKINFDINGGDYIIKPRVIKTRLIED